MFDWCLRRLCDLHLGNYINKTINHHIDHYRVQSETSAGNRADAAKVCGTRFRELNAGMILCMLVYALNITSPFRLFFPQRTAFMELILGGIFDMYRA